MAGYQVGNWEGETELTMPLGAMAKRQNFSQARPPLAYTALDRPAVLITMYCYDCIFTPSYFLRMSFIQTTRF